MSATSIDYVGDELALFVAATNWKAYLRSALAPHVAGEVAEVGAGLGATSRALADIPGVTRWTCIEPDPAMAEGLSVAVAAARYSYPIAAQGGTLSDLAPVAAFDTILYVDVLEHIDDDRAELIEACRRLRLGGKVVVLCPAWQFLYSPFDAAVGHYRRHTKASLRRAAAPGMIEVAAFYMDAIGMMASLVNKLALRQSMPTLSQVKLWDKAMVPVSRLVDPLVLRSFGKSVVLVWVKA